MSGIALIIPGADFSDSPLGQVTFSKSLAERAAEAVEAYATAIGSHEHDAELVSLVTTLMELGVWDTIDVFPMLGDTIAKKIMSLNRSSYAIADYFVYPETMSISNGELLFTNATLDTALVGTIKSKSLVSLKKGFTFMDGIRTSSSPNTSNCGFDQIELSSGSSGDGLSARLCVKLPNGIASSTELFINKSFTERHTLAGYVNSKVQIYADGVKAKEETANAGNNPNSYFLNNVIGCNYQNRSANTGMWDGIIKMAAFGTIENEAKAKSTVEALQAFLDTVKPRN
jgi:hypothetical protein